MDKATRDRFALLDFDPPPAKAASPPAPDPPAIADQQANANAQQYAMLQAMQNYQQGFANQNALANQLGGAQQNALLNVNALYGYAAIYPELAARIINDPPAPDDAGLSPLDRLRYLLAGRTPPK